MIKVAITIGAITITGLALKVLGLIHVPWVLLFAPAWGSALIGAALLALGIVSIARSKETK